MPRRPNTRPTNIYWLFDIRTGVPFYCGKTVHSVTERLSDHRYTAAKFPNRPVSRALLDCGDNVGVELKEIVSIGVDWVERERHWIAELRILNPDCVNVSNGGDGPAGMIHSADTRAKIRAAQLGRKMPAGHGEKIAAKTRGQKRSAETVARMSVARKGEVRTPEQRAKIRAALTGRKAAPGVGAKISAANMGRTISAEHRAAISRAQKGKQHSAEARAKMSAAALGRKRSPEAIEKSAAAHRGKIVSAETRARASAAQKGRPLRPEHIEALRAAQKRRRAREAQESMLTITTNVVSSPN